MLALQSDAEHLIIDGNQIAFNTLNFSVVSATQLVITYASNDAIFQKGMYDLSEITIDGAAPANTAAFLAWTDANAFSSGGATYITNATRPDNPVVGKQYYNTDSSTFEGYDGASWFEVDTTAIAAPAVPASITPAAGNSAISEAFAAAAGAASYQVQASDNNFASVAGSNTGNASPIVVSGLTNGTAYKSRVRSVSNRGVKSAWRTSVGSIIPALAGSSYNVAADGDSQTAGVIPFFVSWYTDLAADLAGNAQYLNWYNEAVPGEFEHGAAIDAHYDATKTKNILFFYSGINLIRTGTSGADAYTYYVKPYILARQAAGWTVIPFTLVYDKDTGAAVSPSVIETEVSAFNALMLAHYNDECNCAFIVDVQTNPFIGGVNAPDNLAYFLADKLHLNNWGQQELEGMGMLGLNAAVNSLTGVISYVAPSGTYGATHHADHSPFFTYYGDADTGGSGAGYGAFRDSDLFIIGTVTQDTGCTFDVVSDGTPEVGVDFYANNADAANADIKYRVDGGAWLDPVFTNSSAYPYKYLIRGLGGAGTHSVDIRIKLKNLATPSGQYIFDGADIYERV